MTTPKVHIKAKKICNLCHCWWGCTTNVGVGCHSIILVRVYHRTHKSEFQLKKKSTGFVQIYVHKQTLQQTTSTSQDCVKNTPQEASGLWN